MNELSFKKNYFYILLIVICGCAKEKEEGKIDYNKNLLANL
jgi:hypothetical protein